MAALAARDRAGRAGRGDDPLRDRRRRATTRSSRASSRRSAAGPSSSRPPIRTSSCTPPTVPPLCASRAPTSTWFAVASAYTGWTPSGATRSRAGSTRRSSWSPTWPRSRTALPARAPATDGASSPSSDTLLGVLPIGYGDGWRRALSNNGEVLIAGQRRPIVGTVSMDNLTVDLGADAQARGLRGSEAVLIGARGDQRITAEEVAQRMDTINYEVTCGLTARVPRVYHHDGERRASRQPSGGGLAKPARRRPALGGPRRLARRSMSAQALEIVRWRSSGRRAWLVGGAVRDRAAGTARRRSGRRARRRPGGGRARDRPAAKSAGAARGLLCALRGVRGVARGRARWGLAGRRGGDARRLAGGRSALARLHRQRDRRAAGRGRAARPAWRARRSACRTSAHARAQTHSRTIPCACCAWCGSRWSLSWSPSPRRSRPRARRRRDSQQISPERVFLELRRIVASRAGSARTGADERARRDGALCCRSSRRCGGSSRAAFITATSTATRWRCSSARSQLTTADGCERSRADRRAGRGAARAGARPARRAACRRDDSWRGAALGGPAARRRQAGHALGARARPARDRSSGTTCVGRSWRARCSDACTRACVCASTWRRWCATTCASAFSCTSPSRWRAARSTTICTPASRWRWTSRCCRCATGWPRAERKPSRRSTAHVALARRMLDDALRWRRDGPPKPLLRGDQLARELGIALGPRVGELLAELARAQYTGEVSTREQALAFVRRRAGAS